MQRGRIPIAGLLSAISMSLLTWPAVAAPILVFNTGVDSGDVVLHDGAVDPHYSLVRSPNGAGHAYVVDRHQVIGRQGPWLKDDKHSKWIGPVGDEVDYNVGGKFAYRMRFDLTGFDPSSAILKGKWTSDNNAKLYLNGADTGNKTSKGGFTSFVHFSAETGFVAGINTLDFIVTNIPNNQATNPTGLRVQFTRATVRRNASEIETGPQTNASVIASNGITPKRESRDKTKS